MQYLDEATGTDAAQVAVQTVARIHIEVSDQASIMTMIWMIRLLTEDLDVQAALAQRRQPCKLLKVTGSNKPSPRRFGIYFTGRLKAY